MIVRTYGRRNRTITRSYTDNTNAINDDVLLDPFSDSQETPQDFYNFQFPSQESTTSLWSSLDPPDPYSFPSSSSQDNSQIGVVKKPKKSPNKIRRREREIERPGKKMCSGSLIPATSTLMEAQEFGEMMEHVDEVNFALDGLKKGQPVRIRRASLLSLLAISGTVQQRRLLRTQGFAKTITDAILGLSFDDSPSNLAAAALFYILTSDGQDDHILELPSCIQFLIKLLKPMISTVTKDKGRSIGGKLLALCKDSDILRDTTKTSDSSSAAIFSKVQDILISCKEMKSGHVVDGGVRRPELNPKWMALLTMEKACLSKISFEDTTGTVRKTGGNFKEKLRELGGLDAVFEVAVNCYLVIEGWAGCSSPSIQALKDDSNLQSLELLLKCLKIMENATFLSKDNQTHLLGMKGSLDSSGSRISCTKLVISVIKILSGLYLLKSPAKSSDENPNNQSNGTNHASELALISDCGVDSNEAIFISSSKDCSFVELSSNGASFNMSQDSPWSSTVQLAHSISNSETTATSMNDSFSRKMRVSSSTSGSCSGMVRSSSSRKPVKSNGSSTNLYFDFNKISNGTKDVKTELLEESQDPFAFDEDDFEPSKWDLLSGKKQESTIQKGRGKYRERGDGCEIQLMMSQQESSNWQNCQQISSNVEQHKDNELSCSHAADEEISSLLGDCLLTAVKVLMNLTNDNPIGCQQIAACGGLESMSLLIASHFPSFSSSGSFYREIKEDTMGSELNDNKNIHLSDQELDFLVAILGLLVNLVEKDGHNRSRLAATNVSIPTSEGFDDYSHGDVIPLLSSIFIANRGVGDAEGEEKALTWNDEAAILQGEKEAEKMIVEAYSALLLAFLSTESKSIRDSIAECLPNHNIAILVPVLERFLAFHLTLNMISPETHKAVSEVIESCRIP